MHYNFYVCPYLDIFRCELTLSKTTSFSLWNSKVCEQTIPNLMKMAESSPNR